MGSYFPNQELNPYTWHWKCKIFFFLIYFYWRIIALENFAVFCQTSTWISHQFSSVQFCHSVLCDFLRSHESQHARLPCPSPTSKLSIQLDGDAIQPSHSVVPFSSCLLSFPASGSFPMSQFFDSGGQSIRVSASASVFPVNIQDWFPLELTGLISLQSKGLSRVISNTLPLAKFFSALRHKGLWCCTSSKPLKWHLTASSKCRDSTSTTWH